MDRKPLRSSTILSASHDPETEVLTVSFAGGDAARYSGVPSHVVDEMMSSASPGRFFNAHIRGHYAPLEPEQAPAPRPRGRARDPRSFGLGIAIRRRPEPPDRTGR